MTTENKKRNHKPIGNEEEDEHIVSSTQTFAKTSAKTLSEKKHQKQRYIGILLSSCIIAMCIVAILIDSFVVRHSINQKLDILQEQADTTNSKLDNITQLLLRPLNDLSFVISTKSNVSDIEIIDTLTKNTDNSSNNGNSVFKSKKDSLMYEMISINKQVEDAFDSLSQIQKEQEVDTILPLTKKKSDNVCKSEDRPKSYIEDEEPSKEAKWL